MSAKRVQKILRADLVGAGFVTDGSRFVQRSSDMLHTIEIGSERRLTGFVYILHHIAAVDPIVGNPDDTVVEKIASHQHKSPYPTLWDASSIDNKLVMEQISPILHAFRTRADFIHFHAPQVLNNRNTTPTSGEPPLAVNSLSTVEASAALQRLAPALFEGHFSPAPQLGEGIWASNEEVDGYRHCVLLQVNNTRTLCTTVQFALSSSDIARGRKSDDTLRRLFVSPKRTVHAAGYPMLIPLTQALPANLTTVKSSLINYCTNNPPNLIPK